VIKGFNLYITIYILQNYTKIKSFKNMLFKHSIVSLNRLKLQSTQTCIRGEKQTQSSNNYRNTINIVWIWCEARYRVGRMKKL